MIAAGAVGLFVARAGAATAPKRATPKRATPNPTSTAATIAAHLPALAPAPLPDGVHYGLVKAATVKELDLDKVDFLTGKAAIEAARAAHELDSDGTLPNDYFIRNANKLVRTLSFAATARLVVLPNSGDPSKPKAVTPTAFVAHARRYPGLLVKVAILGGRVVRLEQIFLP